MASQLPAKKRPAATRVVIIGYGPIGHALVEQLVETADVPLKITVFCEEPRLAYNRVAMTSYFQHQCESDLLLTSPEWLADHNVKVVPAKATKVDRERRRVLYGEGKTKLAVAYDELVLATGSEPFLPPVPGLSVQTPGIFMYRTIEDMKSIVAWAEGRQRAAVIGGGLLGLEAAKALSELDMDVHILEAAPHLMPAQLDAVAGKLLRRKFTAMGVTSHTAARIHEVLSGEGGVRYIRLETGGEESFLEVDLLIVSAGVRPRDELARQCGLELGARGGVKVDCRMRSTSDPHIYAVGEVASYDGGMVYGLWKPGTEQAEVLAGTLGSPSADLKYHGSDLSTKLKVLGVDVASFGGENSFWHNRMFDLEDGEQKQICVRSALNSKSGSYRKLVFRRCADGGRRLLGGILVNSVEDYYKLYDMARSGREMWGLETAVLTHGPGATPDQIEEAVYPIDAPLQNSSRYLLGPARRVVIIGHGPIGHYLLSQLIETSEMPLQITVFCGEPLLAYNRVAMTSFFEHRSEAELLLTTPEWMEGNNVKVIFAEATEVDRSRRRVLYRQGGSELKVEYDELVMATGSVPFVPAMTGLSLQTPGVFLYRTIEDMKSIIAWADGRRKAAVLGGGLLGLEAAKALSELNMEVHILEVAPHLMSAQLDPSGGEFLKRKVEGLGFHVHVGIQVSEVLYDSSGVTGVRFDQHEQPPLKIDLLIVSAGVRPRDELARQCGLELGARGGVKVDCRMRSTSDPHIYAVGEVASYDGGMVYGLWKPGTEQAEVLAGTLGSPSADLKYHGSDLSTKLKVLGVDVASFGADASFWQNRMFNLQDGEQNGGVCVRTSLDTKEGTYRKLVFKRCAGGGRRLLGGVLVNSTEDYHSLRDLACSGRDSWGLEPGLLAHGPRALPGQIEESSSLRQPIQARL
eukprot:TRINITY_DN6023_c0_g1_i1.p1 TRINITY_DN6023_c0_g1~~TRINITY_DN6023_c0_g1_i1.p1  ORF type:complete len:928 (-),score=174.98 TRINITY_DN6023_c0_g1_i1:153-2900(-)